MNFEEIISKEYLTKAEYEFCVATDATFVSSAFYIGDYSKYGDYLNMRAYSEHDKEKRDFQMEVGF